MRSIPVNPRAAPTADQMKRAKITDRLFAFHSDLNKLLGGIAIDIIAGADITTALGTLKHSHYECLAGARFG